MASSDGNDGNNSGASDTQSVMTEPELLNLIRQYEQASLGSQVAAGATISTTVYPSNQTMTTLEIDRYNALNAYFARPLGNEIENRSQIVLPELRDTIEWIKPQLMRMFVGSKTVCRFEAENPQDEQQAEIETAVVNHVLMNENDGFMLLHDFFTDALLMRNGYAEVYTEKRTEITEESYSGLSEVEVTQILQDKADEEADVLEQREYTQDVSLPLPQLPPGAPVPPQPLVMQIPCFDIKLRIKKKSNKCKVRCLPPEEMRVSARARAGMEGIPFAAHITNETRSDLISDGIEADLVNTMAAGRPNWLEIDALARNQVVDQMSVENPADKSMQEIEVRRCILRVDYDGDGIAELRRVLIGGDKIVENEVIEETPFASCLSKRMPHRHTGISLYDEMMDLQIIKTQFLRAGFDNLAVAINQRIAVDYESVNLDDLLTSRPYGVVRGKGPPANWIQDMPAATNVMEQVLPALEYIDKLRANRTGIGEHTMGLDADELQNVTKGAQLAAMSTAALKVEMVARFLAEGVKDICGKIHSELRRNQNQPLQFRMAGKWLSANPSEWGPRSRLTVNVGLGSGNREELRANVQLLGQAQGALAQAGMVGPKQMYETFKVMCEALGFNAPERFAMDPSSPEFAQHMKQMQQMQQNAPPAPQVQAAKIRAQTVALQEQAQNQRSEAEAQVDLTKARTQMIHEALQQQQDRQHDMANQHKDREVQLDQNHLQIILKLIPAVAQILAAEKAAANELGSDVEQAAGSIQ